MIKTLRNIFKRKKEKNTKRYEGVSDFFLNASADEKKEVITEAARRANEDQLKIFKEAHVKVGAN